MPTWVNWCGRHRARPAALRFVRSEEDAAAVVREAAGSGRELRVAGAGHSHAPLVPTDGVVVDTSGLAGVIDTDRERRRAWVWAGTPIHALGRPLHDAGLALVSQGDIDRQTLAGAVSTGTHGSGAALPNLSAAVTGARLVLASGETVECRAGERDELFQAARLGLGAVGLLTRLEIQLRDAYRLAERGGSEPFEALHPRLPELAARSRHFEFFWYPHTDAAVVKSADETDAPPRYPLAEEGSRVAWSYEVLPSHRPHLHTEMEYSVAAEDGPACLLEIRRLLRRDFAELRWPVEYRSVAADDVWISMAHGRATVTISIHQGIDAEEGPLYAACEEVFRSFGGRPHWGKVHGLGGEQLAPLYPRWHDWWAARDAADPDGLFLNDALRRLRGASGPSPGGRSPAERS